eukprot:gene22363-28957_t
MKNKGFSVVYIASTKGQGIGELSDCISFINIDKRDDISPIRYGMTVGIKSSSAKDKLLGIKESKPGFYRNLIGQGEKWIILKGKSSSLNQYSLGSEDIDSRGQYVRIGDLILLQTFSSSQLLTLYEGASGSEAQLQHRESSSLLGYEMWQIELFSSQPIPVWLNRPYLSRRFLLNPSSTRVPSLESETRCYPGFNSMSKTSADFPLLNTYPIAIQQQILLRDIICVLTGVEGQYIRVGAETTTATIDSTASTSSRKLLELKLIIDIDTSDRATANQISQLLPLCESIIHIREFLRLHNNYDCGLLSLQKLIYLLQPTRNTIVGTIHPLIKKLLNQSDGYSEENYLMYTKSS